MFLWAECNIRIFAKFRQNHLFSAGDKTTVFQNDRFDNLSYVVELGPRQLGLPVADKVAFDTVRRNFLPEIFGEVHPETAPLQALCCALCSTEQSTFRGEEKGEKVPRKGRKRVASKGAKRNSKKGRAKTSEELKV